MSLHGKLITLFSFLFLLGPPRPKMMRLCTGFVVDKEDSSVTRSDAYFRDLFKQTGFHLYKTRVSSWTFHANDGVCYVTNLCSAGNSAICISMINFNFWHAHWMGFLTKWIGVFFGSYRRGSPKICLQCACMRWPQNLLVQSQQLIKLELGVMPINHEK